MLLVLKFGKVFILTGNSASMFNFYIYCTTQLHQPTGDGCDSFDDDSDDGMCYEVLPNAQNWKDAQMTCQNVASSVASIHNPQENSFIRRLAVANGAVNGVYLG
ncbi:hypothetical protein PENTCL1PPCAC_8823, partial [Pristionchus entomophagus]